MTKKRKSSNLSKSPEQTPQKTKRDYKYSLDRLLQEKADSNESEELEELSFQNVSQDLDDNSSAWNQIGIPETPECYPYENIYCQPETVPEYKFVVDQKQKLVAEQQLLISLVTETSEKQNEFIAGEWIQNCFQSASYPVPEAAAKWLFHTIAYSLDARIAANALKTLENLLHGAEPACAFLTQKYLVQQRKEDNSTVSMWVPSLKQFLETFEKLGIEPNKKISTADTNPKNGTIWNLKLVINYLALCIRFRPSQFSEGDCKSLLRFVLKFSVDESLCLLTSDCEVLINEILSFFLEENWATKLEEICQYLSKPFPVLHMQNVSRMMDAIPVSSRGLELKSFWSVTLLHDLFQKEPPKFDKGHHYLEDILKLIRTIKISKDNDHNFLLTVVSLVDQSLNNKNSIRGTQNEILELKQTLNTLSSSIKEASGYNPVVTKFKETIVALNTRLQLLTSNKTKRV